MKKTTYFLALEIIHDEPRATIKIHNSKDNKNWYWKYDTIEEAQEAVKKCITSRQRQYTHHTNEATNEHYTTTFYDTHNITYEIRKIVEESETVYTLDNTPNEEQKEIYNRKDLQQEMSIY